MIKVCVIKGTSTYLRLSAKHMYLYFSLSTCEFVCVAMCSPYACVTVDVSVCCVCVRERERESVSVDVFNGTILTRQRTIHMYLDSELIKQDSFKCTREYSFPE